MKLVNCSRTSGGFTFLVLVIILFGQLADADPIIHESATMGPSGQMSGWGINSTWFMGSRFYIGQEVQVTAIGGHLVEWIAGDFFGVIVSLNSASDLPDGYPFYASEVVASTVFDPGMPSSDFRTPLSVTLTPGYYALIFGSGRFGSLGGEGALPYTGQSNLPGASFILWDGSNWWNSSSDRARFVVEGIIDYCDASGSAVSEYLYIEGVQVGTVNNIPTGNDHYADYTALSATLVPDVSYPITVTRGNPFSDYDKCTSWVDWNQDGDFYDLNERITMTLNPNTFTGTVRPPADAVPGDTRMRVRIVWNEVPQPCGDSDYGEVEDYTITFVSSMLPKISGHVRTADSEGIEYVLITGTNNIGSTMTDVNGYYELTAPTNPWSGGLTPSKTYWDFFPDMWALVSVTQDTPNTDFEGTYNYNYGGGQGTMASPYLINTAEHMNEIGTHIEHWGAFFKLMADIDLVDYTGSAFNIIGNVNDGPFSGWFNGNGHKIYNFTYHSNGINRIGLFGDIDGTLTTIENLTLINPDVDAGTGERVGALVGQMSDSSRILDCKVIGGSVSGAFAVGGLAGFEHESIIGQCFSSSSVSGGWDVGGLVGMVWRATLSGSYSTGPVQSNLSYIGGLAGSVQEGTVYECYAMGSVSGGDSVGGLVGEVYAYSRPAVIRDCYAAGLVSGDGYAYGLIGFNYVDAGSILDSFWDVESSGQLISLGGTGLTTAEMHMQSTFTDAGWDFTTKPAWKMNCEGMSYPKHHWWQPVLGDFGCPDGVNFFDFSFFASHWAEDNCAVSNDCDGRDLDQLGSVDINDLRIFADNWLAGF